MRKKDQGIRKRDNSKKQDKGGSEKEIVMTEEEEDKFGHLNFDKQALIIIRLCKAVIAPAYHDSEAIAAALVDTNGRIIEKLNKMPEFSKISMLRSYLYDDRNIDTKVTTRAAES